MIAGNRTYRRLFAAQLVALAGTGLTTIALGLLAYDLAGLGAGAVLGGVLAAKMLVNVVVAPVATALVDRLPRRAVLVALDLLRCGVALLLPFVTAVWQVFALVVALQVAAAAFTPAYQAVIPLVLTDERDYTRALSLSRLAYDLESIASPVLAAALLSVISFSGLFVGTAVGFAASAALVLSCTLPDRGATREPFAERTVKGVRAYLRTPRLRAQLGLNVVVASAGAMVLVNTVVLVRPEHGDTAVAVAMAAFGAGSMASALVLPRLLDRLPERVVMTRSAAALATLLLLGSVLPGDWSVLLGLWVALGVGYSAVLTPVGRLIRVSASPADLPALFAAQFALSHGAWAVMYPLAGLLAPPAAFLVLGLVASAGLVFAIRAWPDAAETHLDHVHTDLPDTDPHLADAVLVGHGWRHRHRFVIDRAHPRWP